MQKFRKHLQMTCEQEQRLSALDAQQAGNAQQLKSDIFRCAQTTTPRCEISATKTTAQATLFRKRLSNLAVLTIALIALAGRQPAAAAGTRDCFALTPTECRQLRNQTGAIHEQPPRSPYDRTHEHAARVCRKAHPNGLPASGKVEEFCYTWRYQYVDEQNQQGNDVRILDESLDERLANSIYTGIAIKPVNIDFFDIDSGDAQLDKENLRALTSAKTDDKLCGQQLAQMLALQEQLDTLVTSKRSNESSNLQLAEEHIRLARVLDSFGHYEGGLFAGRSHSPGSFDQCITSRLLLQQQQQASEARWRNVGTRFCWARLGLNSHLSDQLRTRKTDSFETPEKVFSLGTCLPEACHTRSFIETAAGEQARHNLALAQRLIDTQFHLPESQYINPNLPIKFIYCMIDETSPFGLSLSGKLALAFIASWLLLTIFSTYYQEVRAPALSTTSGSHKKNDDHNQEKATKANFIERHPQVQSIMECLNLKRSYQDFVEEPKDEQRLQKGVAVVAASSTPNTERVNLDVMNPIKVLGCSFVVLGHSIIIQICSSMNMLRAANILENDPVILSMIVGTVVVDTFFVITGILMAYIGMQRSAKMLQNKKTTPTSSSNGHGESNSSVVANGNSQRKEPIESRNLTVLFLKQWANTVTTRHLRLLPLFCLVYWFKRSVLIDFFGRGKPFWDNGTNRHTLYGSCKLESWFTPLNMMIAFLPLSKQCLPQAWSVANDLFFAITVTPIVILMHSRPKAAAFLAILMATVSYSLTLSAYFSIPEHMVTQLGHLRTHGFAYMFGSLHHLYTYPQFRLTSIITGLLAGYVLHQCKENNGSVYLRWLRNWPTKLSFGLMVYIFVGTSTIPTLKPYMAPNEQAVFTHLFTTGRILWSLSNAIIFIRMATDWKDNFLMRQFASRFWHKLTKLNLAILLLHMDLLMFQMGNSLVMTDFTRQGILVAYGFTYLICLPLAIFVHVVFENPIDKLIRRHIAHHITF